MVLVLSERLWRRRTWGRAVSTPTLYLIPYDAIALGGPCRSQTDETIRGRWERRTSWALREPAILGAGEPEGALAEVGLSWHGTLRLSQQPRRERTHLMAILLKLLRGVEALA